LPVFMSVRTTRRPPESNCMPLVMPLGDRNTVVAPVPDRNAWCVPALPPVANPKVMSLK
jgi:hypothetical protein